MTIPDDLSVPRPEPPAPPAEVTLPEPGSVPPAPKRGRGGWLACLGLAVMAALALAVLGLAGGFFGVRIVEGRYLRTGQAALEAKDWLAAEVAFSQALGIQPAGLRAGVAEAVLGRGIARYHQDKHAEALADFDEALALDSSLAQPYYYRAAIYFAQDDLDRAVEAAASALERDESLGLPYAIQAYAHLVNFEVEAAQTAADAALERDDSLALAYRVRGILNTWNYDLEAALGDLDQALGLEPLDVQALAARVYVRLEMDDSQKAEADVKAAVAADPQAPDTLWAQAMLATYHYDSETSLTLLDRAIAQDDRRPEFYVTRSYSYRLTDSDGQNGLADVEQALKLYPDYAPALAALAWRHFDLNETDTLEAEAQRLLALNPKRPEGHDLLTAYFDDIEDDDEKALEQANKLIELFPGQSRPYVVRGYLFLEQRDYEKAQADFEHAREIRLEYVSALFGLSGIAQEQRDSDKALQYLDEVLKLDPRNISAQVDQARIFYLLVEDNDRAWEKVNAALAIDPDHPGALLVRASLHMAEGDTGQAYQDFGRVLDRYPRNGYAYHLRSMAYLQDGNLDRAEDDALKSIELAPNLPAGYWSLALIAYTDEDWAEVVQRTTQVLEEDSGYALALELRGNARFRQNKVKEAIADLESALQLDAELEEAYATLTSAYFLNSQIPEAIEAAETLLDKTDDVDVVAQAESFLAFLKTVPPAVDGLHTFVDEDLGYSIGYSTAWVQVQLPEEAREVVDILLAPKDLTPEVEITVIAFDGASGATPQLVAEAFNQNARALASSFKVLERKSVQIAGRTGVVQVTELTLPEESGAVRSKQYYVVRGDVAIMISLRAPVSRYSRVEKEVDEIALSLTFLP